MAALKSAKHEAFARAIVGGRAGAEAYQAVYSNVSGASARTNAARLLTNANILSRIAELKAAAADATVMDLREVLAELSNLGRANMADFVAIAVSDNLTADVQALPREQSAAISEVTVESYSEPGTGEDRTVKRVKFKLHDKRGALAELRRHYEPQRHELSGKDGGPIETREYAGYDLARRLAFLLAGGKAEVS